MRILYRFDNFRSIQPNLRENGERIVENRVYGPQ